MRNQWRLAIFLYLIPLSSSLAAQSSSSDGGSNSRLKPLNPSTERWTGGEGYKTTTSIQNTSSVVNVPKDRYTETFIQRKSKRKNNRIRNPSAPMVDSTLLRFLSQQKVETKSQGIAEEESTSPSITQEGDIESWNEQFMYENVKNVLIENGAPKSLAHQASMVVQAHVLSRIKQRRVRYFLKKRDIEWEKGGITNGANGATEDPSLYRPEYGLKDIIDLLFEFKLTGHDIAAILKHTPGIALMMPRRYSQELKDNMNGETLEDTLYRAYDGVLLDSLGMRRHDAKRILRSCPGLLTLRGSKRAEDILTLMTSLGVSLKSLARTKAALPVLLSRSPTAMFRLISFLASDALRMPLKNIGPLLRGQGSLRLIDSVAPVYFNEDLRSNSRNMEQKRILINEQYRKMSETAWALRNKIGTQDLTKVISAYPSVLLLNAEEQILPAAAYLMDDIGICKNDLPRVLQLYPFLLGKNVKSMQAIVEYFLKLGVQEEDLPGIIRAFPSLLTKDIESTMIPVVRFLQEIGIVNVGRFITRLPPVLGYSVEDDLKPKWEYLSKVCLYPSFELSTFPAYFSYPLDRVIKTRYEYLKFVKKVPTDLLALDLVLRHGDKDFARLVANDLDEGKRFEIFVRLRKEIQNKELRLKREQKKRSSTSSRKIDS